MNRNLLFQTRKFSGFVLRHPAWSAPKPVGPAGATLHDIPATLDTFLALHTSPDAAAPTPPRQPGRRSMWAARKGHVVLFDAWETHTDCLEEHWDHYDLVATLGPPSSVDILWGRLDHLEDNRD